VGAREVAVVLAGSVTLAACTTTHTLGRLDDPAERARVEEIIAYRTTYAEVTPVLSRYPEPPRVVGITSAGLQLEPYPRATPVVVPGARVQYLVTYDHLRGARDGALALGIPTFVVGALAGLLLFETLSSSCTGGCRDSNSSDGLKVGLAVGGIAGFFAAAVGAGFGALAGHEDRYVPAAAP
jgi:hypothetical protein